MLSVDVQAAPAQIRLVPHEVVVMDLGAPGEGAARLRFHPGEFSLRNANDLRDEAVRGDAVIVCLRCDHQEPDQKAMQHVRRDAARSVASADTLD